MVNELNIRNATVFIQTNAERHKEKVLGWWSEAARELLVHDGWNLRSHVILTVDEWLADAAELALLDEHVLACLVSHLLRDEAESLVEWEHLLALIDDL